MDDIRLMRIMVVFLYVGSIHADWRKKMSLVLKFVIGEYSD